MRYSKGKREHTLSFRIKSFNMVREKYGEWLAGYDWGAYSTGTFRSEIGPEQAYRALVRFHSELQRKMRGAVVCFGALEGNWSGCGRPGSRFHWHLLLAAAPWATDALLTEAQSLWEKLYGNAKVERYERSQSAAYYMMKHISDPDFDYQTLNLDRLPYLGADDLVATSATNPFIPDHVRHLPRAETMVAVPTRAGKNRAGSEG